MSHLNQIMRMIDSAEEGSPYKFACELFHSRTEHPIDVIHSILCIGADEDEACVALQKGMATALSFTPESKTPESFIDRFVLSLVLCGLAVSTKKDRDSTED